MGGGLTKRDFIPPVGRPGLGLSALAGTAALALLLALPVAAAPITAFDQANQDYAAGRFAEAARGFEQVIQDQGYSAPALFNLGNAWVQAGDVGRAVLSCERALAMTPGDTRIANHLRLARQQAELATPEPTPIQRWAHRFSWNTLTWTGSVALLLFCTAVLLRRRTPSAASRGFAAMMAGGAFVAFLAVTALLLRWSDLDRAVVLAPNTEVRLAPADAAGTSFTLSAGEIVHLRREHGDFVLIRTPDGRTGWANRAQVARVLAMAAEQSPVANQSLPDHASSDS